MQLCFSRRLQRLCRDIGFHILICFFADATIATLTQHQCRHAIYTQCVTGALLGALHVARMVWAFHELIQ